MNSNGSETVQNTRMELGSEYESGRRALADFVSKDKRRSGTLERNEATTRLQAIDYLLFQCLGWDTEDCVSEEAHEGLYTDYSLKCPRKALIVEAKKEGTYFELPAGHTRIEYSIKSLCRDNDKIDKAIRQAMGYCASRGVPIGAVFNGHQIIAFVASREDGIAPIDGKAVVFQSPSLMLNNFLELWQFLSKAGVREGRLSMHLLGKTEAGPPKKLADRIYGYPGEKGRNDLQAELQILADFLIEDAGKLGERLESVELDFLKSCYSASGALSQHALASKNILRNRYAAIFDKKHSGPAVKSATNKQGVNEEVFSDSLAMRPILLLGDVGVGKTMFIRRLRRVEAADILGDAICLYLDLGSKAALAIDLPLFFRDEIDRQLDKEYGISLDEDGFVRGVYHGELKKFSEGIFKGFRESDPSEYRRREVEYLADRIQDRGAHIGKCLAHIAKGRRKKLVLFLDNADQRDDTVQQRAFMIAQEVASSWPVTVFLSLRPETFYKSKKHGTLSGYHPKAFSISPPRPDLAIEKRLAFALRFAKGELRPPSVEEEVQLRLRMAETFIKILQRSLRRNKELIEFIENVCNGNIRVALEFVSTFMGSGHVFTKKIFDIEARSQGSFDDDGYIVPLHEFLRAIIYGDHEHYDPRSSKIANLFDIRTNDGREHFLLPIVISFLRSASNDSKSKGFVELDRVFEVGQSLGFTERQMSGVFFKGLRDNLIEGSGRHLPDSPEDLPEILRSTTVGIYHVEKLVRLFTYVDAMIVDTPILLPEYRKFATNVTDIHDRLSRTAGFCSYLDDQWQHVEDGKDWFDWKDTAMRLRENIQFIRSRVSR